MTTDIGLLTCSFGTARFKIWSSSCWLTCYSVVETADYRDIWSQLIWNFGKNQGSRGLYVLINLTIFPFFCRSFLISWRRGNKTRIKWQLTCLSSNVTKWGFLNTHWTKNLSLFYIAVYLWRISLVPIHFALKIFVLLWLCPIVFCLSFILPKYLCLFIFSVTYVEKETIFESVYHIAYVLCNLIFDIMLLKFNETRVKNLSRKGRAK